MHIRVMKVDQVNMMIIYQYILICNLLYATISHQTHRGIDLWTKKFSYSVQETAAEVS
jgi:hypothetical protein